MHRNQGWFDEQESSKVSPDFIIDPVAVDEVTWTYEDHHMMKMCGTSYMRKRSYVDHHVTI